MGPMGSNNMPVETYHTTNAQPVARHLFPMAGISPQDLDCAQIYDAFSSIVIMALEDYGVCEPGEGADFVMQGNLRRDGGKLPTNTAGGLLSEGYLQGFNLIPEAVRQMRGTSLNQVAALDARTGQTVWTYDPGTWKAGTPANTGLVHRGVSYWEDGDDRRVLFGTGDAYLIALDADTGQPVAGFGDNGRVDLTKGLRRPVKRELYAVTSPPVICRDVAVVGAVVLDAFAVGIPPEKAMPPGDVRGFDVRTGAQKWVFETIPQEGDFGNETWEQGSWQNTGNTNVWTMMSADPELNRVYLPVSTPTNDYYGGHRPGDNLFAESIVCLDAASGEQYRHHLDVASVGEISRVDQRGAATRVRIHVGPASPPRRSL